MRFKVFILVFFLPQLLIAQQTGFSLYPVNPLLINPAFTGVHGRAEVLLNYRQNWIGIEDAPSISTFQFDKAISPQISLGLQARRSEIGALNIHDGNLLFAYKVLLGKSTSLNFGLAAGITSQGLNSSSTYNPADPAIQNLPVGEISPDLRFGANYHFHGLNLGISFTEMLPNRPYVTSLSDNSDLKFYENYIVNLDYKFNFKSLPLAVQPFGIYNRDKFLNSYLEGGALFHYNDLLYLGGLYRQNYGAGILAGLQVKDFRLSYGYELASNMVDNIGQGSHELQLSFRFGRKPVDRKPDAPQIAEKPTKPATEIQKDEAATIKVEKEQKTKTEDVLAQQEPSPEKESETQLSDTNLEAAPDHAVYYSGDHPNELSPGFYVISGAFDNIDNAQESAKSLSRSGVFAATGYNSERKLFFVYVYRSDKLDKTKSARGDFRKKATLKEAWLLEIR